MQYQEWPLSDTQDAGIFTNATYSMTYEYVSIQHVYIMYVIHCDIFHVFPKFNLNKMRCFVPLR